MKCRDRFVAIWFFLLYVITWAFSLAGLFGNQFWDQKYNMKRVEEPKEGYELGFNSITKSYFIDMRYVWFLPHVLGAIFWWNLYFLQLIPKVRHYNNKKFHRMLGRFLLVLLLAQNITGFALAATSHSNIIKLVSYVLCIATIICIVQAWRYAYWRNIPKHKYWAIRLVGYMHTISLQRFWLGILIMSHAFGWEGLYPGLDDDSTDEEWIITTEKMFDDSFILCILTAILTTEWYLAAEGGMTEAPVDNRNSGEQSVPEKDVDEIAEEAVTNIDSSKDDSNTPVA
ncbi:MAG: hypothetical protein SGBAC_011964 [Bacillariaceae sp.]